jgi:uncharacterized protein YehS (DUF1456 family)
VVCNLGNTPAERQRNQKLINNNNQDYARICSGIFLISYLNGLLLTRLIADSNSRLVLYLLRKKGGLLNSLLISASYNTKDLATTLGHETSHAIDNQDPSINTNPQNNASKADNEIYAQNYGDDFSDYVEFASENYGDGNLADSNNS